MRVLWMVLLLLVGCNEGADSLGIGPPPAGGQLGQSNVYPECGALHQACLVNGLDSPLARGASLGLGIEFRDLGNAGPPTTLDPVDPTVLDVSGAVITGRSPGVSGIFIREPNEHIVDFIHIWVADATQLRIIRHNSQGLAIGAVRSEATIVVEDEILLSMEAFSGTQPLLGVFETTWSIEVLEGDDPITIVEDIVFGWFRLLARSPGKVRLTADALGQQKVIELEVLP